MSSSSYGQGVQMQSLGQGLAAAASMYATLSMQGKELEVERTKAENRKLELDQNAMKKQGEASTTLVADALSEEEKEEAERKKRESTDLSAYGKISGQSSQNDFQFGQSQTMAPTQSMDDGKSFDYIGKALNRSERNDFASNSQTGGSY